MTNIYIYGVCQRQHYMFMYQIYIYITQQTIYLHTYDYLCTRGCDDKRCIHNQSQYVSYKTPMNRVITHPRGYIDRPYNNLTNMSSFLHASCCVAPSCPLKGGHKRHLFHHVFYNCVFFINSNVSFDHLNLHVF